MVIVALWFLRPNIRPFKWSCKGGAIGGTSIGNTRT
jgi:hypothetical protein